MKHFFSLLLACALLAGAAHAQPTYDLQFIPSVDENELVLRVQIRLQSGEAALGTANLKFSYDPAALSFPPDAEAQDGVDYTFFNFDGRSNPDYAPATVNSPAPNAISINIVHNAGAGTAVGTAFMDVAEVRLSITNSTATPNFGWDAQNTIAFGVDAQEWISGTFSNSENVSLPVEMTSFAVVADGGAVQVAWSTASETNNAGFDVQFAHKDSTRFQSAGFVAGQGTSTSSHAYALRFTPQIIGTYQVRLKQVDFDGAFVYTPMVEVAVTQLSSAADGSQVAHSLSAAYPNPFRQSTALTLQTVAAQHVSARLYNAVGQHVRTIWDAPVTAGSATTLSVSADELAPGLYVLRVVGETFTETRQVMVVQ